MSSNPLTTKGLRASQSTAKPPVESTTLGNSYGRLLSSYMQGRNHQFLFGGAKLLTELYQKFGDLLVVSCCDGGVYELLPNPVMRLDDSEP